MVKALKLDYWSDEINRPYLRVVIGFILTPLILSFLLSIIAWVIYGMTESEGDVVKSLTLQAFLFISLSLYIYAFTGGIAGFLVLWALRIKSFIAYVSVGVVSAILLLLIAQIFISQSSMTLIIVGTIGLFGAMFMACLRMIIKIK